MTDPGGVARHRTRVPRYAPPMPQLARKARPNLLRRMNERTVFDLIRRGGPASRADLKRLMGVSAPTTSKAVANLLARGLLEEVGTVPVGGAGRPVVVYRLARNAVQVLGANIGARTCAVFPATLDGEIAEPAAVSFPTPKTYEKTIAELADAARQLMARKGVRTLGLGLTAPGEIDAASHKVLFSPNLRLLDGRSPADDLRKLLSTDVSLVHDTVASGLAEQSYGVAREMTDFVRIGVYEAFGVSVVTGGRLFEGRRGLAGELGHVTVDLDGEQCSCGNRGCLETVATDTAFARALSRRLRKTLSPDDAVRLARDGKPEARAELDRALTYLAVGAAAAINVFNPQAVLVCSRMFDADPDALDRLRAMTAARALRPLVADCRILRTDPNVRQGAVAAIIDRLANSLGPPL